MQLQWVIVVQYNFQNQSFVNFIMRSTTNDISQGANIILPKSVVRTISLEKLKQQAPLSQKSTNILTSNPKLKQAKQTEKMYQKIVNRKLNSKNDKQGLIEKGQLDGKYKINKKIDDLKQQVQRKQFKQCTFKPQINPSNKDNRSVGQFFNDQLQHVKRKNDKIEEMRIILQANRQKDNIFRPNAMLNRQRVTNGQQTLKVHERLYEDSKNKDKHNAMQRQESTDTLRTNSITKSKRFKGISRGNSSQKGQNKKQNSQRERQLVAGSENLYKTNINMSQQHNFGSQVSSITSRKMSTELGVTSNPSRQIGKTSRQNKSKEICKRVDVNILQKKDNHKSEEIYVAKLMKQMTIVIQKCNLPLIFSYMEMNLFFEKMNFIPQECPVNTRKHLYQIWSMLQGQIFKQVSALSIMKIVYSIMGCHNVNLINKHIHQIWLSNEHKVAEQQRILKLQGKSLSFKQNILMINERDSKTIKQSYEQLYVNRLKLGQSELLRQQIVMEYSFKPTISKTSNELAERYRNRILCESQKLIAENKINFAVPENGQIDHAGLLELDSKRKEAVLQMKRESLQKQRKKVEQQSLNPLYDRESNTSARSIQRDRNQQLYQMGKHANLYKKDKSSDQVEQQRWKNELTFKPKIKTKTNILQTLNSKDAYIPDYDKTIYRMYEARKSKENSVKQGSDQMNNSPLLYLNVVMEGCEPTKLPVYRGDSLKSITQKVRGMMQLQQEGDSGKLQRILRMQIMPALTQMGLQNLMRQ